MCKEAIERADVLRYNKENVYWEGMLMKKDAYSFDTDSLYYLKIEREILKHYNLGTQNSSNLPGNLSEDDSGEYVITGTRAGLRFYLEIIKTDDGKYNLTCYPE